jgi:hypothetical protein
MQMSQPSTDIHLYVIQKIPVYLHPSAKICFFAFLLYYSIFYGKERVVI